MSKIKFEELLLKQRLVRLGLQNLGQYMYLREKLIVLGYKATYSLEEEKEDFEAGSVVLLIYPDKEFFLAGSPTTISFEDIDFDIPQEEYDTYSWNNQLANQALTIHKLQEENKALKTQLEGARKGLAKMQSKQDTFINNLRKVVK